MSRHFYFSVHKWYIANRTHFVNDISVEGFFFAFSSVFYLTSCAWLLFDHAQNNSIDSIAINFTTRSRRSLMTTCINQFIADGYLYADDKQFENVNMPKRKTILKMIENPFFWISFDLFNGRIDLRLTLDDEHYKYFLPLFFFVLWKKNVFYRTLQRWLNRCLFIVMAFWNMPAAPRIITCGADAPIRNWWNSPIYFESATGVVSCRLFYWMEIDLRICFGIIRSLFGFSYYNISMIHKNVI